MTKKRPWRAFYQKNRKLLCQTTAIARSLLRPGGILILDESTSALDAATEEALLQNLYANYHQKKTIIFVSHRQAVVRFADKVIEVRCA